MSLDQPRSFATYISRAESGCCPVCGAAQGTPCGCRWCSSCAAYWQSPRLLQRTSEAGEPHIRLGIAGETCGDCVTIDEPITRLAYRIATPHLHAFVDAAPAPGAACDRCGGAIGDEPAGRCDECGLLVCDPCR